MTPSGSAGWNRKHKGLTLAELLVALLILGALGGFALRPQGQTARREAERAMSWLYSVLLRADRGGRSFSLFVAPAFLEAEGFEERLEASRGCSFSYSAGRSAYSAQWGTFTPAATIRVRGPEGDVYYLVLSGQGRVRVSPVPPP